MAAIQIMLEKQYRETLRSAEARLRADLHMALTAEQHDLVRKICHSIGREPVLDRSAVQPCCGEHVAVCRWSDTRS